MHLTLLIRTYCHLCDEMREALAPIAAAHGALVTERDVDDDLALERAFGDLVPVLLLGDPADGRELCHFHLDVQAVEAALASLAAGTVTRR
jgi:hypothetical protein